MRQEFEVGRISVGRMWRKIRNGWRVRISELKNGLKPGGERAWSHTLTDAVVYAYQNRRVLKMTVDSDTKTFWCIIGDRETDRSTSPEDSRARIPQGRTRDAERGGRIEDMEEAK